MSIADKKMFCMDFEGRVGEVLTVAQTAKVMKTLAEVADNYDVTATNPDDSGSDSEDMLRAFLEAKEIEGRSKNTIERYRYIVNRMSEEIRIPFRKITVYHLRSYLMDMRNLGMSDSTIGGYREVLCSMFGWLYKEGLIERNPCANLSPIKCPKVVRLPYSDVELERIKESCKTIRDKAIVSFLLSTGCRISEMCALNRDDIDYANLEVTVLGKGNKERTVYLSNVAVMNLRRYLAARKDTCKALFIGKRGNRLTPHGARAMLKVIEKKSGVENVHPHRFRRTLTTNLISRGMPIQDVAAILGHDKLDTTMRYVYIDRQSLKSSYHKYA